VAPDAVKVAVCPEPIVGEFTVIFNGAPIVTVAIAVLDDPLSIAVTV
jgi:hypothetical protein